MRAISRDDQPGDEETRDHEEHVDAEEARGQGRRREVIDDDRRDRDRAQAVERADVASGLPGPSLFGSGHAVIRLVRSPFRRHGHVIIGAVRSAGSREESDDARGHRATRPRLPRALTIFLVSLAGLLLEVGYTRIVSYKLWYYYTYLVIGLALLGIGSGSVFVAVFTPVRRWTTDRIIAVCVDLGRGQHRARLPRRRRSCTSTRS